MTWGPGQEGRDRRGDAAASLVVIKDNGRSDIGSARRRPNCAGLCENKPRETWRDGASQTVLKSITAVDLLAGCEGRHATAKIKGAQRGTTDGERVLSRPDCSRHRRRQAYRGDSNPEKPEAP